MVTNSPLCNLSGFLCERACVVVSGERKLTRRVFEDQVLRELGSSIQSLKADTPENVADLCRGFRRVDFEVRRLLPAGVLAANCSAWAASPL